MQSRPCLPILLNKNAFLILPYHLRLFLTSGLFTSGLPTKTLYAQVLSPVRTTCLAHINFNFITRIIFD